MTRVAAFGIGSTNFRYAVARSDGTLLSEITVEPTRPTELVTQVVDAIDALQATAPRPIDAVAMTCPGLVDPSTCRIRKLDTPDGETIPTIDVGSAVQRSHDLPVYMENDCNASALAEWHYGARETHESVAHVTFGTGIGGGVVERGRLVRGESGGACEFGLLSVDPTSDMSSSGVTGAWEAFCSGRGIPGYVSHRLGHEDVDTVLCGEFTAQDVFQAAADGDSFARNCLERIGRYNAAGLGAICNTFEPGLLTLGGGVALNNAERIVAGIEAGLDEYLFVDPPTLRLSPLGDDVGLYGALAAFQDQTTGTDVVGTPRPIPDADD